MSIKSRGMRWIGHVACMENEKYVHYLIRQPEGKRPLARPSHREEVSIKMDLTEIGCGRCALDSSDS
jgi:hypothetical protein